MFQIDDYSSYYMEDYRTLHHDIGLVKRTNGTWDLWFGQDPMSEQYKDKPFLDIIEGDLVSATEVHSLQVGIIVACLTSWNYLNRSGNPIYTNFGNESYSLLKKNKGANTQYKIKHFFLDCLNRMRRVYSVEYLDVYEVSNNPYVYKVKFKVLSITNTLVDGEFYLDVDSSKNTSVLDVSYNHPYTSVSNPLFIECVLRDEYGSFIENELIYIYIRNDGDEKFKFYGITEATDSDGLTYITIPPKGLNTHTQIMLVFKGNTLYNPCTSKIINIQVVQYYIKSRFEDNKHILYIDNSKDNKADMDMDKFRLGELLSDYVDITNLDLTTNIPIEDINANYLSEDYHLEWFEDDANDGFIKNRKLYLIPTDRVIYGTNKVYYKAFSWNSDHTELVLTSYDVQLNTNKPYETHFLIQSIDNGLFEISFDDGHLYYEIDLYENEI